MKALSPFSVRPRNGSKGTALPGGKTVRERCPDVLMCDTILVACTWIAGREFQKADGKAGGLCEEAAAFPHESFKMGMALFLLIPGIIIDGIVLQINHAHDDVLKQGDILVKMRTVQHGPKLPVPRGKNAVETLPVPTLTEEVPR